MQHLKWPIQLLKQYASIEIYLHYVKPLFHWLNTSHYMLYLKVLKNTSEKYSFSLVTITLFLELRCRQEDSSNKIWSPFMVLPIHISRLEKIRETVYICSKSLKFFSSVIRAYFTRENSFDKRWNLHIYDSIIKFQKK